MNCHILKVLLIVLSIARATGATVPYHKAELEKAYHASEGMDTYYAGAAAKIFGLQGRVDTTALANLFNGFSPDGKIPLVQRAGSEERHRGLDMVGSMGKGESILGFVAGMDSPVWRELLSSQRSGVAAIVEALETKVNLARRGKGGLFTETSKLSVACFEHFTSRAGDPIWHTHLLLPSIGVRADGTIGAIQSLKVFQVKMVLGQLFRAELAFQLQSRLGLRLEPAKVGYRVVGISDAILRKFSKRREAIERTMAGRGWNSAKAAAAATLLTRGKKKNLTVKEHAEICRKAASHMGLTETKVKALIGRSSVKLNDPTQRRAAVDAGLSALSSKRNYFSELDLIGAVSEAAISRGVSGRQVLADVSAALQRHPDVVRLGTHKREVQFSTKQILGSERELLGKIENGRDDARHCVKPKAAENAIRRQPKLSEEQKAAIRQVTVKPGLCQVVSGYPGTGKTTLLRIASDIWKRSGHSHIVGLAFTGKAAQQLQDGADIPSCTIDRYLKYNDPKRIDIWKHHAKQIVRAAQKKRTFAWDKMRITSKSIVVVDEASLISRSQLLQLWKSLERQAGGPGHSPRIVLLGDCRQLQALWHPGAFDAISRRLDHVELKHVVRQKEEWAREAVLAFAQGNAEDGLRAYASRGHVHIAPNRVSAHQKLIADWALQVAKKPESGLILAATNSEVRELNARAQELRRQSKQLGLKSLRLGDRQFYVNDRLVFTKNNRLLGVKNGQLGTIDAIDRKKQLISVRLDNKKRVVVPLAYYQDIDLGYSLTVMRAQGCTTQFCFFVAGKQLDRELATVAMSRAETLTKVYSDRFEAGDKLSTLVRQMERSRRQVLASDLEVSTSKDPPGITPTLMR